MAAAPAAETDEEDEEDEEGSGRRLQQARDSTPATAPLPSLLCNCRLTPAAPLSLPLLLSRPTLPPPPPPSWARPLLSACWSPRPDWAAACSR